MNTKSEMVIKCQKKKKQNAVNHFGGKCSQCGYDKCLDALEFHHLEKTEKEESPTYVILRWSWKRAFEELKKCILVCSNCHREIHSKVRNIDLIETEYVWVEKECVRCHEKFPTKNSSTQIYCSPTCYQLDNRKVDRPNKNDLKILIDNKTPWRKLGHMFGVSDNAVRKWAKSYDLI